MPRLLVVENETRYVERIRDALTADGWTVEAVADRAGALQSAAAAAPELVLVNVEVEGAGELLAAFARSNGGAGSMALLPEVASDAGEDLAAGADDVISKPFADSELRLSVKRCLRAPADAAAPARAAGADGEPSIEAEATARKLTSREIFGDLLAEFDNEGAAPLVPEPAAARAADPEIERRLEETLSGLLDPPRAKGATPQGAAAPPATDDDEVEALLSRTLSQLDLGAPRTARRGSSPRPASPVVEETPRAVDTAPAPEAQREPEGAPEPSPEQEERSAPIEAATEPSPEEREQAAPIGAVTEPAPEEREQAAAVEKPAETRRKRKRRKKKGKAKAGPADAAAEVPLAVEPAVAPEDAAEAEVIPFAVEPAAPGAQDEPADAAAAFAELSPAVTQRLPTLAAPEPPRGRQFGQYALLEKIAVGGMAEVWKARMRGMEGFQKTVAIKKILPHLTGDDAFVSMFIDEAKLAAQLSHPNITHIYDLGKIGEDYFIAMEYVEGRNLRVLLNTARARGLRVPLGLALLIAARLASALDYAHRKRGFDEAELGLVHRDVSPQNVLISYEGDIKLCDFGIVKAVTKASHTQMGALKGKLQYMSPEQAWGRQVDGRSDLFSLGALTFELLTSRRLFPGDNELSVLDTVRQCQVEAPRDVDPSIPEEVDTIVRRALAKEPDERYQTAGALGQELEAILYSIKPTPSQADLASFMVQLFGTGAPAVSDADEGSAGAAVAPAVAVAEAGDEPAAEAELDELPLPPELTPVGTPTDTESLREVAARELLAPVDGSSDGADEVLEMPEVAAVAPTGPSIEIEEGGSRGKGWLVAAILVLIILGVLVGWLWSRRPAADVTPPTPLAEIPPATAVAPAEEPAATGTAPVTSGAAVAPTAAPEEPALDVEQLVDEELARRERELRRRFEEEQRRLEEELAATQAAEEQAPRETTAEPPVAEPPAKAVEPPAAEPPAKAAEPAAQAAEPALVAPEAEAVEAPEPADEAAESATGPAAGLEPPTSELPAAPGTRDPAVPAADRPAKPPPDRPSGPAARKANEEEKAESPPAAEPPPPKVRIGQLAAPGPGVTPPVLVSIQKPEYPPLARRLRVEGVVEIDILVDENGKVTETRLTKAFPRDVGLNEAALAAARTAKFEPATKDGVRVKYWTKLKVPFQL